MPGKKTLLLVFIHGFKGGDDTFGTFPETLQKDLTDSIPHLETEIAVYPKYETRGDLPTAVTKFTSWLEEQVIDIESGYHRSNPTGDPNVAVLIFGHSMGGILGADAILHGLKDLEEGVKWPHVKGLLAFDTPYVGVHPTVFAGQGQAVYDNAQKIYQVASGLFGSKETPSFKQAAVKATASSANKGGGWGRWGLLAGGALAAAGAVAAGTAAYQNKDVLQKTGLDALGWVQSHLAFVSVLFESKSLQSRVHDLIHLSYSHNIGWAQWYTELQNNKTFCLMPDGGAIMERYLPARNEGAKDEVDAHCSMFLSERNEGYERMKREVVRRCKEFVGEWGK
ncbi:hypothetical protein SAICODRAFT_5669 [Saitoella complicata NRRL Y-17804]|uniref:uncharacterized protein n=1 Tax=Saitoella complicata (strain BCRC 22490 / CBS 7301 / JCM 7358 / NBRC 10748 / NRRL Y-17804) TaxID=698492 RepID=UPI0008674CFE|nr:uncharacterized protein SAICODRAFT_5669 [Saitoella complicata NRRL Y-17804]ODQ55060.1 hypothetical protein SAICODRAFT_5669 [Saitoella complicata NRRL Y-17804]